MMAKALKESSTQLTPKTLTGDSSVVFQSEWDHINKVLKKVSGSNVVDSAAGIMFQDRKSEIKGTENIENSEQGTKQIRPRVSI